MQKNKICIIDDNEAVCNSLKFLFESVYELKVIVYNNPLVFLKDFSSAWNGLLLIDLFMPSMNGLDLTKMLTQMDNKMHILIMSGHASGEMASQALKAGAQGFIMKPFKIDKLLEKIGLILNLPPLNINDS